MNANWGPFGGHHVGGDFGGGSLVKSCPHGLSLVSIYKGFPQEGAHSEFQPAAPSCTWHWSAAATASWHT